MTGMKSTPEKVRVELGDRSYDILVAPGLLSGCTEALCPFVEGRGVLVVADSNTGALYGKKVTDLVNSMNPTSCALHIFPAGESSKHFATVEQICRAACQAKLDRKGIVLALGGGVTGDMAGFAASIYMRGIEFIQLPTSMLAMIDSSVGGKTGVDLPEGKNLMGTFHQPKLVLIDTDFLNTLPPDQLRSGLAELLKHAVLFDPELFEILETEAETLLTLKDPAFTARIIARSCGLKAAVVSGDEREGAQRALLNLGHSFGHAVEKLQNFCGFSHGAAVAYGTAVAAELACRTGHLSRPEADRITNLFRRYELPVTLNEFTPEQILEAMAGDKKNMGGKKRLILPTRIGNCEIFADLADEDILAAIGACRD